MSFTKPEVNNLLRHTRGELSCSDRQHAHKIWSEKLGSVPERCMPTDKHAVIHADRQTNKRTHNNTLLPYRSGIMMVTVILKHNSTIAFKLTCLQ